MDVVPENHWDAVAEAWARGTERSDRILAAATEAMIAALDLQVGQRLLELAAGTGSLGGRWAELVGDRGRVTVSDLAPAMVDVARQQNQGHANVEAAVLDLTAIDRPDRAFDAVGCRMGLMFAPDPGVACREALRVLVPGGRFAALTWGRPEDNPWLACLGFAAAVNGVISGGPPTEPGGVFSLSDPVVVHDVAVGAGLGEVSVAEIAMVFTAATVEEHFEHVASLAGPLSVAIAAATAEQRAALFGTAAQFAAGHTNDDGVALPGRALLLVGRRV